MTEDNNIAIPTLTLSFKKQTVITSNCPSSICHMSGLITVTPFTDILEILAQYTDMFTVGYLLWAFLNVALKNCG